MLALGLAVVSWHTAWNLGGAPVAVGYSLALVLAATLLVPVAARRARSLPPGARVALAVAAVAALVVGWVLGPPAALHEALGVGSDRSNALGVALTRLADGQYPYTATTYLGHPVSPLPGALLLAAPAWWLTGDAGAQNVLWLPVLLLVVAGWPPRPGPLLWWALAVFGGIEVLREFVVGDDLVTGVVPAVAAAAVTLRVSRRPGRRTWAALVAAGAAVGVTTCVRPHLVLVAAVVVAAVAVRAGPRAALAVGGSAALSWAVLVTPFLFGGLERFSPLHVSAKVTGERGLSPGIVVVALVAAAVLLAVLRLVRPATPEAVGWCAAGVLFAPSLLSWLRGIAAGAGGPIDLTLGAAAVPFALWALASRETGHLGPSPRMGPAPPGNHEQRAGRRT